MSRRTDLRPVTTRYSESFKLKVIREMESGASQAEVQRKYDIPTNSTIISWLKKYGKNHLLSKVVRVEDASERNRIKRLEEEKAQLEKALAQTQIKLLAMESLVEVAEEYYKADFKKNFGHKQLAEPYQDESRSR
jgi:transposase